MSEPPDHPGGDEPGLPARRGPEQAHTPVVRTGMFGVHGTQDTSGYGKLQVHRRPPLVSEPPYGGYFDAVAEALGSALQAAEAASATRSSGSWCSTAS